MKRAGFLFGATAIFGIGCFVSYFVGYNAGKSHGYSEGHQHADSADLLEKHHYEFKQNGASIFRFDSNTGESCWIQLSDADGHIEDRLTHPMQQCTQ